MTIQEIFGWVNALLDMLGLKPYIQAGVIIALVFIFMDRAKSN